MSDAGRRPAVRASNLFLPVETVGTVTDGIPLSVYKLGTETFILTSLGRSYYVMDLDKLRIVFRSGILPATITALHGAGENVYVALDGLAVISIYHRISHIGDLRGHRYPIRGLFTLNTFLVSWSDQEVFIWDLETLSVHGCLNRLDGSQDQREISCVIHPETYINKLLVSYRGTTDLELWNLRTLKLIHSFRSVHGDSTAGGGSDGITAMCLSIHPDIVALGYSTGELKLLDMKSDKILCEFNNSDAAGAVTSLTCRTDQQSTSRGLFVCGCADGSMSIWDAKEQRLLHTVEDAHSGGGGIGTLTAIAREPLLVSSGDDNAIIVWIFDLAGDAPRELRSRKGLRVPVQHLKFYDDDGKEILCLGADGRQCAFGRIGAFQQHQNCQFQQRKALRRITLTWRRRLQQLPPATDMAFAYSRHYDWPNIATSHEGMSSVFLWSGHDKALVPRTVDLPSHVREAKTESIVATSVAISSCGNYLVVGYEKGDMHKFNLQSSLYRGPFRRGTQKAHSGPITQVEVTNASVVLSITSEVDNFCLRRWNLRTQKWIGDVPLDRSNNAGSGGSGGPFKSVRHFCTLGVLTGVVVSTTAPARRLRSEYMASLAESASEKASSGVICETQKLIILDAETGTVVREMPPVINDRISAFEFSRDGRWAVYSTTLKPYVYVYDVLSSALIDWIAFDSPVLSLAFDPSNTFLYLSQAQMKGGISVLGNIHVFDPTLATPLLQQAPEEPVRLSDCLLLDLKESSSEDAANPTTISAKKTATEAESLPNDIDDSTAIFSSSTKPLEEGRLTLSGVSEGRLNAILHLEQIKQRNKPQKNVTAAPKAPFFIPTTYEGKELKFAAPASQQTEEGDSVEASFFGSKDPPSVTAFSKLNASDWDTRSELQRLLSDYNTKKEGGEWLSQKTLNSITHYFKSLSPSGIHLAMSELGIMAGSTDTELLLMLEYFGKQVYSREQADFIQALLQVFLQQHATRLGELLEEAETPKDATGRKKGLGDSSVHSSVTCEEQLSLLHPDSSEDDEELLDIKCRTPLACQIRQQLEKLQQLIRQDWEPLELQCHQASCFLKFLTHTQIE